MPLLAVAAGRAMPDMAIGYITRKDKAKYIDVQNLFEDEDYAAQFKEMAARFGKYTDYDERKYYHFKLSPDRKDKADPLMVQEYAKACAEKMFPDCECVIATHTDTQTVHSHIVVNAVHPLTGKKLHFNDADYTKLKDMANEIGEEFGFSSLDFRKKAENRLEEGERVQVEIFGEGMRGFSKTGRETNGLVNKWLSDNCFGDYYTRGGLNCKQRELITFCFLAAQGGCEPQLISHAQANMRIGNDREFLIDVVSQCLPYIGYPRSLNALRCVNEAAKK